MTTENKFIEKSEKGKKHKATKKKASKKKNKKGRLTPLMNRLNNKKLRSSIGVFFVLLAIFLFLANISYVLTWKEDQNRVLSKGFFEFIFDGNEQPVANLLGKFGAWTSHLLIHRWFGLSSFLIPFALFITGFKALFKISVLPLGKTLAASSLFLIWLSVFLGFFSDQISYIGGAFGFQINEWLAITLGRFGTMLFVLAIGYVFCLILFNIRFTRVLAFLGFSKYKSKNQEDEHFSEVIDQSDLSVSNILDSEKTKEDLIAHTVDFKEEEADVADAEIKKEVELETEDDTSTAEEIENNDFSVEVAEESVEDKSLSEEEVDSKRTEYGDYDPKLELSNYSLPPIDLLKDYGNSEGSVDKSELEENKNKIVKTLENYKIEIDKIRATVGPTVTLYEIVPAPGVRISKIKNLEDDIALSLAALGIRIIAPIPGKGTIGIEVPNSKPEMVSMRSLIAAKKFQESDAELPIVMGKTITNETYTFDLTKMPHLLVAGATGQGKSVGLNAILISLLYKKHPSQVKFVLVDPKKVELTLYNRIERHFLAKLPDEEKAIITDTSKVVNTLNSLCIEMDRRYELLELAHVRTIVEYNKKFIARKLNPENGHRYLPYIVVLIDEFADLIMTAGKEIEQPIARIAQLARAIGIHLIVATQRPSVNVITGMIKANFPARIAFRVLSKIDSRTILDASGADQLIGRGDMLISTGQDIIRLQCGFVDTPEVDDICTFIGDQRAYPEALLLPEYEGESAESGGSMDDEELDVLFADAARIVVMHQQGSASLLQRKLKLGYNRAGRIVDQLEGMGIIGGFRGSKAREVLYADETTLEEFLASKGII